MSFSSPAEALGSYAVQVLEDGHVRACETFYEGPGTFDGFKPSAATGEQIVSRCMLYSYPIIREKAIAGVYVINQGILPCCIRLTLEAVRTFERRERIYVPDHLLRAARNEYRDDVLAV